MSCCCLLQAVVNASVTGDVASLSADNLRLRALLGQQQERLAEQQVQVGTGLRGCCVLLASAAGALT